MRNLTVGVLEHLKTTSAMDIDKNIKYMQRIIRGTALNKYKQVLVGYKESAMGRAEYQWNIEAIAAWEICTWNRIGTAILKKSYGSSWERSYGGSIRAPYRTV